MAVTAVTKQKMKLTVTAATKNLKLAIRGATNQDKTGSDSEAIQIQYNT